MTWAEFYRKQGRLSEAEPLYRRALTIAEAEGGPDHTAVGIVAGNLAELYRAQGRLADAQPLAQRSAAIREKAAVAAQPSVGSGAEEPANLLSQFNQLNQAGKYAEALPIAEHYAASRSPRCTWPSCAKPSALAALAPRRANVGRCARSRPSSARSAKR